VKQLEGVSRQLNDAVRAPRGKPFLVVTDAVKGPLKAKLGRFLSGKAAGVEVKTVAEGDILDASRRLRRAFRLPADLPPPPPKAPVTTPATGAQAATPTTPTEGATPTTPTEELP